MLCDANHLVQFICYSCDMSFTTEAYTLIRQIPLGKVATYGQIAALLGSPGGGRAVGMAMKKNPDAPRTPCHRVVAADGTLHGYSLGDGIATKRQLLEKEGVIFEGLRVNLQLCLWHP